MRWQELRKLAKTAVGLNPERDERRFDACCQQLCGALGLRLDKVQELNEPNAMKYVPEASLRTRFATIFLVSGAQHHSECQWSSELLAEQHLPSCAPCTLLVHANDGELHRVRQIADCI